MSRTLRSRRRLAWDRQAAATVEFAMVGTMFIGFVLSVAQISLDLYMQESLDHSLQAAVRQIQVGKVPAGSSSEDFVSKEFCPLFSKFASCSNVVLTVKPVDDYYSDGAVATPASDQLGKPGAFCVGVPGQLMFARAVFVSSLISRFWAYGQQATINGTTGAALVSTAAFANENPSGVAVPAGGAC